MDEIPMANAPLVELMCRIHRIHRQLTDLRNRIERGPKMLKVQEASAGQITERLEKVKSEYQRLQKNAREKEQQLTRSEEAIAKRKTQLQEAKNNKEFQALKLQIAADEATNNVLADEALEAIEKTEQFLQNVTEVEAELKKSLEIQEKTRKAIAEDSPMLQSDMERCLQQLAEAEPELPFKFREPYHRLVQGMGGEQALAPINDQKFCGGCRQSIPIHWIAQVIQGETPVTCKSCGRLLYLPEGFTIK